MNYVILRLVNEFNSKSSKIKYLSLMVLITIRMLSLTHPMSFSPPFLTPGALVIPVAPNKAKRRLPGRNLFSSGNIPCLRHEKIFISFFQGVTDLFLEILHACKRIQRKLPLLTDPL